MNNKTVLAIGGAVLAVVIVGAGLVMMSGAKNTNSTVNTTLTTRDSNTDTMSPTPADMVVSPTGMTITTSPAPTGSATQGMVKEFTVEGANFKFTPALIKVKKGDTVRVTFKNTQGFHDFVIDEFDVKTNQIQANDEEEVEFVANKVGTFEYYCSVGEHREMGMVGKLIVE